MLTESSNVVWPLSFVCTLVNQNKIIPNSYSISLSIEPIETNPGNVSIGYKKIKYFVNAILHNSVFICKDNHLVENIPNSDNVTVLFPAEPYDLCVGHVLYSKFLSISRKYFHIDMINIDSVIGDNICYTILDSDESNLELKGNHWWNLDSTYTGTGPEISWGDITEISKFEPKIIKGGKKSED